MLKSCSRCGNIHDRNYKCNVITKRNTNKTKAQEFRSSYKWYQKQKQIRKRDLNFCRICLLNKYDTKRIFNSEQLSVHHIIPIVEDYNRRLDTDNLITLCLLHHEMAEAEKIPKTELLELAKVPPIPQSNLK